MKYALNLADDGRILSATYEKYAREGQPIVDTLPDGDISDYLYVNGEYVYSPLPRQEEPEAQPTTEERISALEAQLATYEAAYMEGVNEA